ncbi:MAG: 2-oxoacid:acceptor oxidoreductase family protein [Candidatus Ratteibacteria bacterium]|nr:2-oxoacid:acceptor oxidoreductase family protein [Candidatus Ratteibacteria bacterium]
MANIVVAGFGGQGILFAGRLLAQAAMEEGKFTTFFPSYGAEMRGGTAHCLVIISSEEIASPIFKNPDLAIFLNEPSAKKFLPLMKKDGLAVLNSSLIKDYSLPEGIKIVKVPATELAQKLGDGKVANLAALGAFLMKSKILSLEAMEKSLKVMLTGEKIKLLDINLAALRKGVESMEKL